MRRKDAPAAYNQIEQEHGNDIYLQKGRGVFAIHYLTSLLDIQYHHAFYCTNMIIS